MVGIEKKQEQSKRNTGHIAIKQCAKLFDKTYSARFCNQPRSFGPSGRTC